MLDEYRWDCSSKTKYGHETDSVQVVWTKSENYPSSGSERVSEIIFINCTSH